MKLPKQAWGTRYNGSTDYNTSITVVQPNAGNAADGTPMPETTIATTWAKVVMWRGKQEDKSSSLEAVSSYQIVIRYPKTWNVDTGMNILVRGQRHNIDSFSDVDGTQTELQIWTWVGSDTVTS